MGFLGNRFDREMHAVQRRMLPHAQAIGQNNGVELDYSDESIARIDAMMPGIVKEFHDEGITIVPDQVEQDPGVLGIVEALGCYVVQCIENNHRKGVWVQEPGYPWPGYNISKERTLYPFDWVLKKTIDPEGYSLAERYGKFIIDH